MVDGGRLAVGTAHHRQVGQFMCQLLQLVNDFVQRRQYHGIACCLQHQGMRQVVDVFRGAGEVNEFAGGHHFGIAGQTFFQPVFDGFDVMVGAGLDCLDFFAMLYGEVGNDIIDFADGRFGERLHFLDARLGGQHFQPFQFNLDTELHQAIFGEQVAQAFNLGGVAAIQRTQGDQRVQIHDEVFPNVVCQPCWQVSVHNKSLFTAGPSGVLIRWPAIGSFGPIAEKQFWFNHFHSMMASLPVLSRMMSTRAYSTSNGTQQQLVRQIAVLHGGGVHAHCHHDHPAPGSRLLVVSCGWHG
jgi:hypothetical protein